MGQGMKTKEELERQWRRARAERIRENTRFWVRTSRQRIQATKTLITLRKRLRGEK